MKTRALTFKELNSILDLLKYGFHYKEDQKVRTFRAKKKIYYLLSFQVNTGLRVGDILQLRRKDILNSRINITEQKTKKICPVLTRKILIMQLKNTVRKTISDMMTFYSII